MYLSIYLYILDLGLLGLLGLHFPPGNQGYLFIYVYVYVSLYISIYPCISCRGQMLKLAKESLRQLRGAARSFNQACTLEQNEHEAKRIESHLNLSAPEIIFRELYFFWSVEWYGFQTLMESNRGLTNTEVKQAIGYCQLSMFVARPATRYVLGLYSSCDH